MLTHLFIDFYSFICVLVLLGKLIKIGEDYKFVGLLLKRMTLISYVRG